MKHYSHKACRRYGIKLCQAAKCPVFTRNYPPGIHGPKRRKRLTEYGTQLAEKQKAKAIYNILERQFRNYYAKAIRQQGDTGEILQRLLELRLDNVIYRAGFAATRAQARQMINHGYFAVNGKRVDIPSYQVKIKNEITVKAAKQKSKLFAELEKRLEKHEPPSWITRDPKNLTVKITALPKVEEVEQAYNPRMIVELYSK